MLGKIVDWKLTLSFIFFACIQLNNGINSKLDFDDNGDSDTTVVTNSSQIADEDVEVKHTIVVSTKLKNNNRRGIHSSNSGDSGFIMQSRSQTSKKQDSGEVPVYRGFKAVETTQIQTPDTRYKPKENSYPDIFINRNIRDDNDVYPNFANTNQWKPSTFYNNINWRSPDDRLVTYNLNRNSDRFPNNNGNTNKYHKKLSDEAVKNFYCCKCREMIRSTRGSSEQRDIPFEHETTTKVKIDGKLAKLN